jgi:hypothetical protein
MTVGGQIGGGMARALQPITEEASVDEELLDDML